MSEIMTIEVQPREETGKNANRRSRARGKIPAVVYGGGRESVSIEVDRKTLVDTLKGHSGENPIFLLKLGDKERHAMIRHTQVDPVSRQVIHIDFQRVLLDQKVRVAVPVELVGTAVGVKTEGGLLDFVTREIEVECLPTDIPENITVDVSELMLHESIRVRDLPVDPKWKAVSEGDTMLVHIVMPKAEEEPAAATPEAGATAAAPAEPEVIKKGKTDEKEDAKDKK